MSVKFKSPTRYMSDSNSLYSGSDNESRASSTNTTPLKTATTPSSLTTAATNIQGSFNHNNHQEFLNVIQTRQLANSSTGWIIAPPPSLSTQQQQQHKSSHHHHPHHHHHNQHIEDLTPIKGEILNELMIKSNSNQSTHLIIIDVRSFNYFLKNRIKSAINVSIPSILLKRPTYTMEKVYESITYDDGAAVDRFKKWSSATNIVFYDHSSYKPSDSGNSATAVLLGSKLRNLGYKGQLNYLQGGFNTFVEQYSNQCEMESLEEKKNKMSSSSSKMKQKRPTSIALPLPTASTAASENKQLGMNPFFSNIRQNLELSHGPLKERFAVRLPYGLKNKDGTISSTLSTSKNGSPSANNHPRFGLAGSSVDQDGKFQLPIWMRDIMNIENGPKKLAQMYEKLERTEQKRLYTIMNYHSKYENLMIVKPIEQEAMMTDEDHSDYFPYSIVSSMEKGTLNRYDNIWPYDYSRVKLTKKDDDYINANYIQYADIKENITLSPISQSKEEVQLQQDGLLSQASLRTMNKLNVDLRSNRLYISTQGPLPTTFNDFWKLIWDENSFVIVMLTQEMEMNKIKCHRYWPSFLNVPQEYGPFNVTLVSESRQSVLNMNDKKRDRGHDNEDEIIIIRKFNLKYECQERIITQLQYTGWTDFGVPDQPIGILQLVHQADEASALAASSSSQQGPMIVHCSAGCGRSGTFCAIDTIIQRLWHERDVYTSTSADKVVETVGRFREQRMSMVQTHRQFVFCYEAILWWLLGYGFLPASSTSSPSSHPSLHPLPLQIDHSTIPKITPSTLNLLSSSTTNTTKKHRSDSIGSILDDFKIL